MRLDRLIADVLGPELPVTVELPDGSVLGPREAPARLVFRSRDAFRRIVTAPGELGFARAYVGGELDLEGDIYAGLALQERLSSRLSLRHWAAVAREVGVEGVRPLPTLRRRRGSAGNGTRRNETRPPSVTTTTSRTTSTGSSSGRA